MFRKTTITTFLTVVPYSTVSFWHFVTLDGARLGEVHLNVCMYHYVHSDSKIIDEKINKTKHRNVFLHSVLQQFPWICFLSLPAFKIGNLSTALWNNQLVRCNRACCRARIEICIFQRIFNILRPCFSANDTNRYRTISVW